MYPAAILICLAAFTGGASPPAAKDRVDHLILVAPDLESGMDHVEAVLGTRPVFGGRHPDYGTHNALLSLGHGTYLEVIAPDPQGSPPASGLLFGLDEVSEPRLATWAMRATLTPERATELAGIGVGGLRSGFRNAADGTRLSWVLTDPFVFALGGAVPFLIDWGETPHPSTRVPGGGKLLGLRLEHPDPGAVREAYRKLGVELDVTLADRPNFVARIRTPKGEVELR